MDWWDIWFEIWDLGGIRDIKKLVGLQSTITKLGINLFAFLDSTIMWVQYALQVWA